jgi:hypothetical protein
VKILDYDLKLGPLMLGVCMVLALLGMVFFALHVHRVQTLHRVDFSPCAEYLSYMDVSKCVGLKTRDHLKHPQWRAAQFVCYMLATILGGIFCAWITRGQRAVAIPLIAAGAGLLASILFNPGGLVSIAAVAGVLLGGAIFQVFARRRPRLSR